MKSLILTPVILRVTFVLGLIVSVWFLPACGPDSVINQSPLGRVTGLFEEKDDTPESASGAGLVAETDKKEQPNCKLRYDPFTGESQLHCGDALVRRIPFPRINIEVIPDTANECENSDTITSVEVGLDANQNDLLDADEVTHVELHCELGAVNPPPILVTSADLPQEGNPCPSGQGFLFQSGPDLNNNQILDPEELTVNKPVCEGSKGDKGVQGDKGENGLDGFSSLVKTEPAPENECENVGGVLISGGPDKNRNGVLDADEKEFISLICNGKNGQDGEDALASLIDFETVSTENCKSGTGIKISRGLDLNKNNVLDESEVIEQSLICNGNDGTDGQAGKTSLIRQTRMPIDDCMSGYGVLIEIGADINNDMFLQDDEVTSQEFLCDGTNGKNSLIKLTRHTTTEDVCPSGKGVLIESGLDDDGNNILDPGEVDAQSFVCDGSASETEDPDDHTPGECPTKKTWYHH